MKVLVACEFSGVVRDAFRARGHDAWSCDLLPCESDPAWHIQGDVLERLSDGWDLMIAHPPCTRLCRSGRHWLSGKGYMTHPKKLPRGRTWESMIAEFNLGVELFSALWNAPIDRVVVENPEMHDIAKSKMPFNLPRPQIVQPHWFGHPEYKATGLYLRGVKPLVATNKLVEPERGSQEWKKWNRIWRMSPGPDRGKERSRFFTGIANAMAEQWG